MDIQKTKEEKEKTQIKFKRTNYLWRVMDEDMARKTHKQNEKKKNTGKTQ